MGRSRSRRTRSSAGPTIGGAGILPRIPGRVARPDGRLKSAATHERRRLCGGADDARSGRGPMVPLGSPHLLVAPASAPSRRARGAPIGRASRSVAAPGGAAAAAAPAAVALAACALPLAVWVAPVLVDGRAAEAEPVGDLLAAEPPGGQRLDPLRLLPATRALQDRGRNRPAARSARRRLLCSLTGWHSAAAALSRRSRSPAFERADVSRRARQRRAGRPSLLHPDSRLAE
jgi:hypothetical protein